MRIALIPLALALPLALIGGTVHGGDGSADSPLTGEDIVRLHLQKKPADELVALIRDSTVSFDIEDDMLEEFAVAGLPKKVIDAMVTRQREMIRPAAEELSAPEIPEDLGPILRIEINQELKNGPGEIRVEDILHPAIAQQFRLAADRLHRITNLGVAVICRTADHVPDQWRSKSALGRDFIATTRHKLLFFEPGASFEEGGKLSRKLEQLGKVPGERDAIPEHRIAVLTLPAAVEVPLEEAVAHDLSLVVAMEIDGDRFYAMAVGHADGVVVESEGATARGVIETKRKSAGGIEVELDRVRSGVATAAGAT